jgi:hypothetical protein
LPGTRGEWERDFKGHGTPLASLVPLLEVINLAIIQPHIQIRHCAILQVAERLV